MSLTILKRPTVAYVDDGADVEDCACLICYDVAENPVVTACCGVTFCDSCARNCGPLSKCPNCRNPSLRTAPNLALRKMLAKAKVVCSGCQAVFKKEEAGKHGDLSCPAVEVACQHLFRGCLWAGRRDGYGRHAAMCRYTDAHASVEVKRLLYETQPNRDGQIEAVRRLIRASAAASCQPLPPCGKQQPQASLADQIAFPLLSPVALCGELHARGLLLLGCEANDLIEKTIKEAYPKKKSNDARVAYGAYHLLAAVSSRVLQVLLMEIRETEAAPFCRWELKYLFRIREALVLALSQGFTPAKSSSSSSKADAEADWAEIRSLVPGVWSDGRPGMFAWTKRHPINLYRKALRGFVADPWSPCETNGKKFSCSNVKMPALSSASNKIKIGPAFPVSLPTVALGRHVDEVRGEMEKQWGAGSRIHERLFRCCIRSYEQDADEHRRNGVLLRSVFGGVDVFPMLMRQQGGGDVAERMSSVRKCYLKFTALLFPFPGVLEGRSGVARESLSCLVAGALKDVLEDYVYETAFRRCFEQEDESGGGKRASMVTTRAIETRLRDAARANLHLSGNKLWNFPYSRRNLRQAQTVVAFPFKQVDYDAVCVDYIWAEEAEALNPFPALGFRMEALFNAYLQKRLTVAPRREEISEGVSKRQSSSSSTAIPLAKRQKKQEKQSKE
mmetsp:Transcript_27387/g.69060  ORF Transcript_27387/g.69060 Transcript_27387/m.69060 type:complete len:674 (+) Transcript_27387:132-2153(+)|eukprot:CAMPEP_0178986920 /NCGR_PEP_ID=MMETSP0795-20121207/2971_1 /TAXON_ID=88552 /ORGANISM="Amoebophrya sp., Strain Ameob2" /LENGTH=673 /DNA_ID=CAMNT_0020678033 /DNA_START=426 /DNA_END=2447 /DNA_ORIENTATION=+